MVYRRLKREEYALYHSDLARRAGVSNKTLYGRFPSKEELTNQIILESILYLRQSEDHILHDSEMDLVKKMRQLLALLPSSIAGTNLQVWTELKRYYHE